MKGIAILLGNYDELVRSQQEQERLNLPKAEIIKPEEVEVEFHFALGAVSTCFKTKDSRIKCQIAGLTVCFKDDADLYSKITVFLETR